jgi:REP element-mobilizing transposase RayT
MARPPRQDIDGAVHHVYARGNAREAIYRTDTDRKVYLAFLARVIPRQGWRCLSYCLMPNHVHLILETPQANLAAGMQRLHGAYAQVFNKRHDRVGHLFQGRYGNSLIRDDEQLLTAMAYVALNPVAAGLCGLPDEWPWSTHAAVVQDAPGPQWLDVGRLLWYLEGLGGDPRGRYADLIEARLPEARRRGSQARFTGSDPVK